YRPFVKGRSHGDTGSRANCFHKFRVIVIRQPRVHGLLHITNVLAVTKISVNKGIHIAELKFQRGANVIETHHLAERIDDFQSTAETAPMVTRHLQDKKFVENVTINHAISLISILSKSSVKCFRIMPSGYIDSRLRLSVACLTIAICMPASKPAR